MSKLRYKYSDGQVFAAIPYGSPREGWAAEKLTPPAHCHDCQVAIGEYHKDGCDVEACPRCDGQLIGCECPEIVEVTGMTASEIVLFAFVLLELWDAHRWRKRFEEMREERDQANRFLREMYEANDRRARAERLTAYEAWATKGTDDAI